MLLMFFPQRQEQHEEGKVLLILTLVCSLVYAALPEMMRIMTGVYSRDTHGVSFYIITVSGIFTNFVICGVTLDALAKSVAQLRMRVAIASAFTQLNSKTAASSLGLFHLELQVCTCSCVFAVELF